VLDDLTRQQLLPTEVIVVDNDAEGSARAVVEQRRAQGAPFTLHYDIQPQRNIALTRNRTVEMTSCEWVAFIDDDERAPAAWLAQLVAATEKFSADGVLGPVIPEVPTDAPGWIQRGSFYDFPRMATGAAIPLNRMRFGNVLLRGSHMRAQPGPFDPAYGLSTGEDADLLIRMVRAGSKIIWCDEAIVTEPVEAKRLSLKWLLQRGLSGGQEFARKSITGHYGPMTVKDRLLLFLRSVAQLVLAGGLAAVTWPLGRHRAAYYLIKAWANAGKISVFWGWRYREYA
jgi:succinoglycan biosynthesis protein ExoM